MVAGLLLVACAPLPGRRGPIVSGVVVDARTGAPVAGALVRVRHEGRYDRVLPERQTLGEGEDTTDAEGRFRARARPRPTFTLWPWLVVETRVTAVAAPGYRCAAPQTASPGSPLEVALAPALDAEDQSASCPAELLAALGERGWTPDAAEVSVSDALSARAELGFGANCRGPVEELALAPDGRHAAFVEEGARVRVVGLVPDARGARLTLPDAERAGRPLRWTRAGALGLVEAAAGPLAFTQLWRPTPASPPAALDRDAGAPAQVALVDSADRNDEAALRWEGRRFELERRLERETGLPTEQLRVFEPDGSERRIALPGEACSLGGGFGHPEERIAADARTALDLRWVEGGCRAVAIDLESGAARRLDASRQTGACREGRRIPASLLHRAVRAWALGVETRLAEAGLDPQAAFTIELGRAGRTRVVTRDLEGETRALEVEAFPVATPLTRIEVVAAGAASEPPAAPLRRWEPL